MPSFFYWTKQRGGGNLKQDQNCKEDVVRAHNSLVPYEFERSLEEEEEEEGIPSGVFPHHRGLKHVCIVVTEDRKSDHRNSRSGIRSLRFCSQFFTFSIHA